MPGSAVETFTDPHEYQTFTCDAQHRVFITAPGAYRTKTTRVDLPRATMRRAWQSLPSISHLAIPLGRSAICFPVDAGQTSGIWGGSDVPSGTIFVVNSGAEFYSRSGEGGRWASLSLSTDALAEFAQTQIGRDLKFPAATSVMQPRVPAMARLLAVHQAISDLAETAPDILARPAVANALEQSLLQAAIGSVSDTETADSQRAWRRSVMVRFENYLEANPDQPLHVIDVCAAVGVSERTLRMHCQAHLGVGPQRYLWLRRMNQVRRSLALADPAEKTVTQIATDYGFWELGRFSVSYRNLFGERPSVTLGRPADMKSPTV
jgi:AraC-like DNA-binding protein